MELTKEHEHEIEKIMCATDCQREFSCYQSRFDNLPSFTVWHGANVIQCKHADRLHCPNSTVFYGDIVFCECPLLKYVAFQLEKRAETVMNSA